MPANAVIFDFDGTLVDTLPWHYEAYRRVLAELGLELTEAAFRATLGGKATETIPQMIAGRPCASSVADIHRRKKALVAQMFASEDVSVLETARLIPVFHGRLALAIASSGSREGIEILLGRLGWREYFSVVVTGEDVFRGKPAPDLFLVAARRLAVAPAECLVFEDTTAGVEAAGAAGMQVFDVRRTVSHWSLPIVA